MSRQHTAAVKAKFEEVPAFATKTRLGLIKKDASGNLPTPPWVLIFPRGGRDIQGRFSGPRSERNPRFTIHFVGSSVENVENMMSAGKAKFVVNDFGVPPVVPGETTRALTWEEPTTIEPDDELYPSYFYGVAEIGFTSEPVAVDEAP